MRRIRSEILFNRALLWLLMAYLANNLVVSLLFSATSAFSLWMSYKAWKGE